MLKPNARDHTGKVTGSIMYWVAGKGTPEQTNEAYLRNIGELPPIEVNYAMRAGSHMEPFLADEFERETGLMVLRRQEEVPHPGLPNDVFVTIDGITCVDGALTVTEFKFITPHMNKDEIFYRYYDQVALQMMCTGAERGLLVVGQATNPPFQIDCLRDPAYDEELLVRIRAWLLCVKTLTPPHPTPMPLPPPERWRTVNLDVDSPNWAGEMRKQLEIYDSVGQYVSVYETAGKAARALVPDDVGLVLAGEFRIARNKRGVLSITRRIIA